MGGPSPHAMLVVLCRRSWLPPEGQDAGSANPEDYAVCLVGAKERWGFPGGPVEPADTALARRSVADGSDALPVASQITAIRRTFECAGMCIGIAPPPGFAREHVREVLHRKGSSSFADFINDFHGFGRLRPRSLGDAFFSVTVPGVAEVPGHEVDVFLAQVPDAEEILFSSFGSDFQLLWWASPSEALRWHESREIDLPLPEWVVLRELRDRLPAIAGFSDPARGRAPESRHNCCGLSQAETPSRPGQACVWLALPGDEEHADQAGAQGCRRRVLVDAGSGYRVVGFEEAHVGPLRGGGAYSARGAPISSRL